MNKEPTDDWLDSTLHQWAMRPLGELPSDIHSRVAKRMSEPAGHRERPVSLVITCLIFCAIAAGWWLYQYDSAHHRDGLAPTNNLSNSAATNQRVDTDSATATESSIVDQSAMGSEEVLAELQALHRQVRSLQAQLLFDQIDAELTSMDRQCQELTQAILRREQECALSTAKHHVISDWLAKQ